MFSSTVCMFILFASFHLVAGSDNSSTENVFSPELSNTSAEYTTYTGTTEPTQQQTSTVLTSNNNSVVTTGIALQQHLHI